MTYWTLEQALTWAMWREEGRAGHAKDGDSSPALPRWLADVPELYDQKRTGGPELAP